MQRIAVAERDDWKATADRLGFRFHTIGAGMRPDGSHDDGRYWDESAYYRFTLRQIEDDLEDPTEALETLCLDLVDQAVRDADMLRRLCIPDWAHALVADSWARQERNLYGRFDFAYDGTGPAKLYEYNADTPTALYESAVFQWVWLEEARERGLIPAACDQFNSIHEALVTAVGGLGLPPGPLHLACSRDSDEDRGTVDYLADCAHQAGLDTRFLYIEDIGLDAAGRFTDLDDRAITSLFKLYPWEWLLRDDFGRSIPDSGVRFIEPAWKAVLSNKAMLPLLWDMAPGHPNLLPAFFPDDPRAAALGAHVRKPVFSREGSNITLLDAAGQQTAAVDGPYGAEGVVLQAQHPLPVFDGNHVVVGSWVVASRPCGIGLREDDSAITRDSSRFLPHVILD